MHHLTPRVGPVNGVTSIKPLSFYVRRPFDYNTTSFSSWCLSFRYFSKNVSIAVVIGNQEIWKTSQPSSYQWVMRQVDIPIPVRPTEISFKPEIVENTDFKADSSNLHPHPHLSNVRNYVGLDDISVLPYSCNTADLNCNYNTKHDINACLWKVSGGSPLVRQADIRESLPNIVSESARKTRNAMFNVNQLISPILTIQEPLYPIMCFQMTFQVVTTQTVTVMAKSLSNLKQVRLFERKILASDIKNSPWLTIRREFGGKNFTLGNFQLEVSGIDGFGIRQIKVFVGSCEVEQKAEKLNGCSSDGKFSCKNDKNKCIEYHQLCNGRNECGDWSDEIGCHSRCGGPADLQALLGNDTVRSNNVHVQCTCIICMYNVHV